MDSAGYTTLTRQSGLLREMQSVANNLANLSTTGYRREGLIFSEHVKNLGKGQASLSMATAHVRNTDLQQGALTKTGGTFDFAIEGSGFFLIGTPDGEQLSRAGSFTPNEAGELVTAEGYRLLDAGGAPIFVPPDTPDISVAADGTLSAGDRALGQIGLFEPTDPTDLTRIAGTRFQTQAGVVPTEGGAILQGYVENSNVDPVNEIARMIEVQHAYQLGQSFMDREDERVRAAIRTLGQ